MELSESGGMPGPVTVIFHLGRTTSNREAELRRPTGVASDLGVVVSLIQISPLLSRQAGHETLWLPDSSCFHADDTNSVTPVATLAKVNAQSPHWLVTNRRLR
jgi:hypothetical protein